MPVYGIYCQRKNLTKSYSPVNKTAVKLFSGVNNAAISELFETFCIKQILLFYAYGGYLK